MAEGRLFLKVGGISECLCADESDAVGMEKLIPKS